MDKTVLGDLKFTNHYLPRFFSISLSLGTVEELAFVTGTVAHKVHLFVVTSQGPQNRIAIGLT